MNLIAETLNEYVDMDESGDLDGRPALNIPRMAQRLILSGYRGHSNKYRIVARLDREDWMTHMAALHAPWDPQGQGLAWVIGLGLRAAADHYQSCYSTDQINGVPDAIYRLIKRAEPVLDFQPLVTYLPRTRGMEL